MYYQRPLFIRVIESFCRYWRIFAVTTITIVVLLVAYIVTRPKNYITQYTVILNTQSLVNIGTGQSEVVDWNTVNMNVNHFQTLVQTNDFISSAIAPLQDPHTPGDHIEKPIDLNNQEQISKLQKGISIGSNGSDAFTVGLVWDDPNDSEMILKSLINQFMSRTAQEKSVGWTEQVAFDTQQVDKLNKEAQDASYKLTAFDTSHISTLPDQQSQIIQDLANEKQRLADAQIELSSDQSREGLLAQQLSTIPNEIVSNTTVATSPLDIQIRTLQLALDEDAARDFKPNHPDVIAKQRQLNYLLKKRASLKGGDEANSTTGEEKQPNPAYTSEKYELDNLQINLEGEKTKIQQLQQKITQEEQGVSKLPEETREYSALLGQYQFYSEQYTKAQTALQDAEDQEEISIKEQNSNYTPLETMNPELSTSKTKTAMLFAGGLVLALLLSAGLVVLAEASDRSFRDAYDLQRTLGVPVLAMLPESSDLHIDDSRSLLGGPSGVKRLGSGQQARLTGNTSVDDPSDEATKAA